MNPVAGGYRFADRLTVQMKCILWDTRLTILLIGVTVKEK